MDKPLLYSEGLPMSDYWLGWWEEVDIEAMLLEELSKAGHKLRRGNIEAMTVTLRKIDDLKLLGTYLEKKNRLRESTRRRATISAK
jgi:hypothetical protein